MREGDLTENKVLIPITIGVPKRALARVCIVGGCC
jgi:hypothetical protein